MSGLMFLDLATTTGWADWLTRESAPQSSFFKLPDTGKDIGRFVGAMEGWLMRKINNAHNHPYTHIYYEMPYIGPKTAQDTAKKLMGLAAVVELCARRAGLKHGEGYRSVNIASIKAHFIAMKTSLPRRKKDEIPYTKKEKAEYRKLLKQSTLVRCQQKGWVARNYDEADALAGLDWMAHNLKIQVPWDSAPAGGALFTAARSEETAIKASELLERAMLITKNAEDKNA